jgi:hypothetical protein
MFTYEKIFINKKSGETLGFFICNRKDNKNRNGIFICGFNNLTFNNKDLKLNDEIIKINEVSIENMKIDDIVHFLQSQSTYELTIKRQNLKFEIIHGRNDSNYSHKLYSLKRSSQKHKSSSKKLDYNSDTEVIRFNAKQNILLKNELSELDIMTDSPYCNYSRVEYLNWLADKLKYETRVSNLSDLKVPKPSRNAVNTKKNLPIVEQNFIKPSKLSFPSLNIKNIKNGSFKMSIHYANVNKISKDSLTQTYCYYYCIIRIDDKFVYRTSQTNSIQLDTCKYKCEWYEQVLINLDEFDFYSFDVIFVCSSSQISSKYFTRKISLLDVLNSNIRLFDKQEHVFEIFISLTYFNSFSLIDHLLLHKNNSNIINYNFMNTLQKCLNEIEFKGTDEPYLYELNGSFAEMKWTLLQLERENYDILRNGIDIHVISSNQKKKC